MSRPVCERESVCVCVCACARMCVADALRRPSKLIVHHRRPGLCVCVCVWVCVRARARVCAYVCLRCFVLS